VRRDQVRAKQIRAGRSRKKRLYMMAQWEGFARVMEVETCEAMRFPKETKETKV
jgi:hypothetical protein